MISEGSYDTEDWSNYAENADLITEINYSLKHIYPFNPNLFPDMKISFGKVFTHSMTTLKKTEYM